MTLGDFMYLLQCFISLTCFISLVSKCAATSSLRGIDSFFGAILDFATSKLDEVSILSHVPTKYTAAQTATLLASENPWIANFVLLSPTILLGMLTVLIFSRSSIHLFHILLISSGTSSSHHNLLRQAWLYSNFPVIINGEDIPSTSNTLFITAIIFLLVNCFFLPLSMQVVKSIGTSSVSLFHD